MTAAPGTASPTDRRTTIARILDFLPGALVTVTIVSGLLLAHTPVGDVVRYALYLLLTVLLPGVLLHRALRGRSRMLLVELGLGAGTGVTAGLAAWALFMVLGIQELSWLWPLLVVVPFLAVPSLRQHWEWGGWTERSPLTSWLVGGALLFYAGGLISTMKADPLPPAANNHYIDVYWHLANAAELTERLPPEVPSVAGRTLRYHWFANADMAHANLISGVDLPTIVTRLWPIPIVAIGLALLVALCHKVIGRTWPAGIAALLVVGPGQLLLWDWFRPINPYPLNIGSPSQVFGLIPLLLAAHVLVGLVRKEPVGAGGWVVLVASALLGAGAKPSVLPVLLAGLGLVVVINLLRREPFLRIVAAMAVLGAATVGLAPLVAQATAASGIKLFGVLAFSTQWKAYAPEVELPGTGGVMLAGLGETGALVLALGLITALVLQVIWVLAGVTVADKENRTDPALVLLAGAVLGGIGATLVIDHAGQSQIYFEKTAVPLAAVLAAWGISVALDRAVEAVGARRTTIVAAAAVVVGAGSILILEQVVGDAPAEVSDYPEAVVTPILVVLALGVVLAAAWFVVRRLGQRALIGTGAVFFSVALVALTLVQGPRDGVEAAWNRISNPPPPVSKAAVSEAETKAAIWVKDNTPRDAILATNIHCRYLVPYRFCDHRAYWLTAFSERRALVESWAYTEENLNRIGEFKTGFPLFPFDDPELKRLNDNAFKKPTAELLDTLRDEYGVTWLYGTTRAGKISPDLEKLADLRYQDGPARVYELR